jgi:Rap1a immunity proteins
MKHSVLLLLTAIAYVATPAYAKDKNPADYRLIVHVLASSRETQLVYRGKDCTSSAYGEIDETDTLTARVYTTCSTNWAAYRYAFAEFDVTNTDPTVNNTVRFLGQCANASGAAQASRILGGLGNAMAAAGGTSDQQAQAEQRSRRVQPIPPSTKCDLAPGDYAGRWQKGELELLLARRNGKYATVSFVVSVVTQQQKSQSAQPTSGVSQDCPLGTTRATTSYGSYCKKQDESTSRDATFSLVPREANPSLTRNGVTDSDLTQDCPQGLTRVATSYGSYCGRQDQLANKDSVSSSAQTEASPTFTHNRFSESGKTFSQDGTNIVAHCLMKPEQDSAAAMLCAGYVEGVADLLSECSVCIPPQVSGQQLINIVLQFAARHEDMLHEPASKVVSSALRESYGCRSAN